MVIEDVSKINDLAKSFHKENKKIVFTNGCFDIFHLGHLLLLKYAKSLGDILILGLNTDESIKRIKGGCRPILSYEYRSKLLDNLGIIDIIVPLSEDLPNKLIEIIKPDIHIKGGDYNHKELPERKIVEEYGGKVIIYDIKVNITTSDIINKIKSEC